MPPSGSGARMRRPSRRAHAAAFWPSIRTAARWSTATSCPAGKARPTFSSAASLHCIWRLSAARWCSGCISCLAWPAPGCSTAAICCGWKAAVARRHGKAATCRPQRRDVRWLAAATVGVCIGCICGISLTIVGGKWLHGHVVDLAAWHTGLYYATFFACLAWAFWRGCAAAAVHLLWVAAIATLAIPLTTLLAWGFRHWACGRMARRRHWGSMQRRWPGRRSLHGWRGPRRDVFAMERPIACGRYAGSRSQWFDPSACRDTFRDGDCEIAIEIWRDEFIMRALQTTASTASCSAVSS